jgi:hypothetical protein
MKRSAAPTFRMRFGVGETRWTFSSAFARAKTSKSSPPTSAAIDFTAGIVHATLFFDDSCTPPRSAAAAIKQIVFMGFPIG